MPCTVRFFVFLTIIIVNTIGLQAQTSWTGSAGTDWNTAGNWSAGVPDAGTTATIPNVTNKPLISAAGAVAKSVTLQTGSALTIDAAGSLTLNGATTQAVLNQGTVLNSGIITIGNSSASGATGILNKGSFTNNPGALIQIDRVTDTAINHMSSTFTNSGTITIGAIAASGKCGVACASTFINSSGAQLNIDQVTVGALQTAFPYRFTNTGTVTIGAHTFNGAYGVVNNGTFNNDAGGRVTIDRATTNGFYNTNIGTFNNAGSVVIGATTFSGQYGILSASYFDNSAGGEIRIDGATERGLSHSTRAFSNEGTITIGANAPSGKYGLYVSSVFTNSADAIINIDNATTTAFYAGNFTNSGKINIGANHPTGLNGIEAATVSNEISGQIKIDRVSAIGIYQSGASFTNKGALTMGSLAGGNTIDSGIVSYGAITNSGQLTMDRMNAAFYPQNNTTTNTGTITIGDIVPVPTLIKRGGAGIISNSTGGVFKGAGTMSQFTNAAGTVAPGNPIGTMTFLVAQNLTSAGTLAIDIQGGGGVAGVDYDQVVVNGTITLRGNLVISSLNGFDITTGQSYVILKGTSVTGSFSSVTWPAGMTGTIAYTTNAVILNPAAALPLTLVQFTAKKTGNKTLLQWQTTDEVNTASFNIERSTNGSNYTTIGTVTATGAGANSYSFTDEAPAAGNNYYRLKMADQNGSFTYSMVITIKQATATRLLIAPVPASHYITVQLTDNAPGSRHAQVFNGMGQLITNVVLTNSTRIDITAWAAGIYTLKTTTGAYQFVKQ